MIAFIRRFALSIVAVIALAALAVGLVALVSGSSGSTTTVAQAGFAQSGVSRMDFQQQLQQRFQRYQQCLTQHGVKPPGKARPGAHRPTPKERRAFAACRHYFRHRPAVGGAFPGGGVPALPPSFRGPPPPGFPAPPSG